jgi:peptidoglycan/xylan/chitin deacetylase (PgdA/CDA1 family)
MEAAWLGYHRTQVQSGPEAARTFETACDHRPMSDDDPDRNTFEDVARVLADEVARAIERLSQIDVDEIARAAGAEAERARRWVDELGRWLREQGDALGSEPFGASEAWEHGPATEDHAAQGRPAGEDPLRNAGPHPLDLPTADQGLALAALDSGRWRVEPGTSALAVHGDGPGPSDALGLVRELRVRDWMTADGAITLAGRNALRRWLDAADRS